MSSVVIHPSQDERNKVDGLVREGLERAKSRLGAVSVDVYLSWTDDDFVAEHMNGVAGYADDAKPGNAWLDIVAGRYEDKAVIAGMIHEYTHVWEYHRRGGWQRRWERLRGEGIAQVVESSLTEYEPPYATQHSEEAIVAQWDTARPKLFEDSQKGVDGFFITAEDDALPNWYGYSAAYHVVNAMLEDRTINDVLQMTDETFIHRLDGYYGE